ncbi:hypothetical protein [Actinospica robiniae]|uniref:hypothetical protein n=1 Tax=Actinospica robiniae TaxID=304901 RepID=UPI0005585FE7|nr:hypothetical protein [Actinospica robiniae]
MGTWTALLLFGIVSWWGLWGTAVEHVDVPNGFDWLCSVSLVGIAVSRWLTRYGADRLNYTQPGRERWFNSGRAIEVGVVLLVPGAACWLAMKIIAAHRRAGTQRAVVSILWALWALSGAAGLATAANPAALFVASLINAAAIGTLMLLETKPGRQNESRLAANW